MKDTWFDWALRALIVALMIAGFVSVVVATPGCATSADWQDWRDIREFELRP